jgi:asparagine synthase (glutamine-hydrolysing)
MCGITLAHSSNLDLKEAFVSKGIDLLAHRGQDSRIIKHLNSDLSVGHRRLAITGDKGEQPITFNNISILTNGEFYDFEIIKDEFYKKYNFKTDSDAEILIPMYLEQEVGQLATQLNGEFVFIIVDLNKNEIIAARDRSGNKTLYYSNDERGFFLSSEVKAFKSIQKLQFDERVITQKLQMQYHHPADTLFKGIHQIEPGTIIRYNLVNKKVEISKYDDLYLKPNTESLDEDKLLKLLTKAVERRIRGQKPAIALSGGLDSSIILELAQQLNPSLKDCFSVSFNNGGIYDEKELVYILKEKFNLNLNILSLNQSDLMNVLEESLYFAEDVAVNLHMPAKYLLFKEMHKQGFKVSLSGEGSDEFFLGYTHFFTEQNNYLKGMHLPDNELIQTKCKNLPTFLKAKLSIGFKIQKFLNKGKEFVSEINIPQKLDAICSASYLWSKYALSNSILIALGDSS